MILLDSFYVSQFDFWLNYLFGGWHWLITIPIAIFGIFFIIEMIREAIKDDGGLPWLPF